MLTMTRTRTQTTLTKLVTLVANVHGELEFLDGLLATEGAEPSSRAPTVKELTSEVRKRLELRKLNLIADCGALHATIRQFDAALNPEEVGTSDGWRKRFGSSKLRTKGLVARYLQRAL